METQLEQHQKAIFREAALKGYERNIQTDNLFENENTIFNKVQMLLDYLKTSNTHVFTVGHYPEFLEGILRKHHSILIVYTCAESEWEDVLNPRTYIDKFFSIQGGHWSVYRAVESSLRKGRKLDYLKCFFEFEGGIKFYCCVAKSTIYKVELRENLLDFFSFMKPQGRKTALPQKWNVVFRGERVKEHAVLKCFGSPFSLTWECAKKLQLI